MPELAEVEIARRNLARWTVGRRIEQVRVIDPAAVRATLSTWPRHALPGGCERFERALTGEVSEAVHRHGKRLGWVFSGPDPHWLGHLGMTGKWLRRSEPPRFAKLGLCVDGTWVWFRDMRRFGCVTPADGPDALHAGLGPDALEPLEPAVLRARCDSRSPIKVVLMDQRRLAGLGNIHAVEVLWRARVHPATPANAVDDAAWVRLTEAIPAHLQHAIDSQAAEEVTYIEEGGDNPFVVYGRPDEPCPRCGTPIESVRMGGRATWFCPGCQAM